MSVPFSQEKLDQFLNIQDGGEFNTAPSITITNVNTFIEDSDANVGSLVASFTASDADKDEVTVILSNTTHYSLGTGQDQGNVLLTQAGLDLINAGGPLPTFQLTPSDGGSSGLPKSITPLVNVVNDAPIGLVTISGNTTQVSTLSAVTKELAYEDGLGTFSYQWRAFN